MDSAPRRQWTDGLKERAPGVHRFLTRDDKPYPAVREALGVILAMAVLIALLWGATGQHFPSDTPVVVVESGSMMHCKNGHPQLGRDCDAQRFAGVSTIDPGDLIFVRDIQTRGDVATLAGDGSNRYASPGDVLIYQPDGMAGRTPIIHRALFWVEVHEDRTFSITACGIEHESSVEPHVECGGILLGTIESVFRAVRDGRLGPEGSGWITKGDNNAGADQGSIVQSPIRPDWVLGKARGEVPWIGLVKLGFTDFTAGTSNFKNAAGDAKMMLVVSLVVLVGGPWMYERWAKRRAPRDDEPV